MTAISTFRFHIELVNNLFIKGFSGRIVHGAFLQFIRDFDPDLSDYLHHQQQKRPYTLTEFSFRKMGEEWVAFFDVNIMDEKVINTLVKLLVADGHNEIFIIDRMCPIFKVEYQKTVLPDPKKIDVGTRIWINFETPTIFSNSRRKANTDPFPHIDTIWDQITKNYSRLVDEIDDTDRVVLVQKLLHQLATPKFKIRSKHITLGHKIKVTGFEGSILFMVENSSDLELLEPILKLSEAWGVGSKTTMGFGRISINIYYPEKNSKKESERKTSIKGSINE